MVIFITGDIDILHLLRSSDIAKDLGKHKFDNLYLLKYLNFNYLCGGTGSGKVRKIGG